MVISAAVNKYAYISVKELMPFFPYKSRITYSEVETVQCNKDIKHRVFNNCLKYALLDDESLEINYTADLPGSIGLATSSTMIVCLLEALFQYRFSIGYQDKIQLWRDSSTVERVMMKEVVGYQDYLPAIYGGCHSFKITHNNVEFSPLHLFRKRINRYGLLFYLGNTRNSSNTLSNYIDKIPNDRAQWEILQLAEKALEENNIVSLGTMLTESWWLKKSLSPVVSTPLVDDVIEIALKNKALGAKLCGSGGGGCVFVLAHPSVHYNVVEAAKEAGAIQIPFKISKNGVERIL